MLIPGFIFLLVLLLVLVAFTNVALARGLFCAARSANGYQDEAACVSSPLTIALAPWPTGPSVRIVGELQTQCALGVAGQRGPRWPTLRNIDAPAHHNRP